MSVDGVSTADGLSEPKRVIAIGSSAGGLDPLRALISSAPPNDERAIVVVQHTSPDHESFLTQLLQDVSAVPVETITHGAPVLSGRIYVGPPSADAVFVRKPNVGAAPGVGGAPGDGGASGRLVFELREKPPRSQLNLPIDLLFRTLAETLPEKAIAVILSGSGSDGSHGIRAIRDADGVIVAQAPESASFDSMPRAALATGLVDLVLPPEDIVAEIDRYLDLRLSGLLQPTRVFTAEDEARGGLLERIGVVADVDVNVYKSPTLKRSVLHRMSVNKCASLRDYFALVRSDASEAAELRRRFLIGVTYFFRDPSAWKSLTEQIAAKWFQPDAPKTPIKVWSVGCSTGEEPYSLAMMIDSARQAAGSDREFRVYATDANDAAIATAKRGVYPSSVLADVPHEMADRYLQSKGDSVSVAPVLRQRTLFARHDVARNAPYINLDLIVCRNTLIYLRPALQTMILRIFSFALQTDGLLFLGSSETTDKNAESFQTIDADHRIFRLVKRTSPDEVVGSGMKGAPGFPSLLDSEAFSTARSKAASRTEAVSARAPTKMIAGAMSDLGALLLVCDDQLRIRETYGDPNGLLAIPEGSFSSGVIDLAPPALAKRMSTLARMAVVQGAPQTAVVEMAGGDAVEVTCRNLSDEGGPAELVFTLRRAGQRDAQVEADTARARAEHDLDAAVDDLSGYTEELRATNEELTSTNEELQSANEELQAVNEELHVLNGERNEKITELELANADIANLLNSVDYATAFLDPQLRIRLFNKGFGALFSLEPTDVGRPLTHFASVFSATDRSKILFDVRNAATGVAIDAYEIAGEDGQRFLVRTRVLRGLGGEPDGAVLSLVDVTALAQLKEEVLEQKELVEGMLDSEMGGYWDWNIPAKTEYLSPSFKSMFGYADHEMENSPDSWMKIIHPDDLDGVLAQFDAHVASRGEVPYDNEVRYFHKDGSIVWVLCRGKVVSWAEDGSPVRMIGFHIDITQYKQRDA